MASCGRAKEVSSIGNGGLARAVCVLGDTGVDRLSERCGKRFIHLLGDGSQETGRRLAYIHLWLRSSHPWLRSVTDIMLGMSGQILVIIRGGGDKMVMLTVGKVENELFVSDMNRKK